MKPNNSSPGVCGLGVVTGVSQASEGAVQSQDEGMRGIQRE